MKGLSIIYSYLLRANLADSFSSPFPELFDPAAFYQVNSETRDSDTTPRSNGVDNHLAESMLISKEPPTHLDTQFPQSRSDVHPIHVRFDQPSTFNDQSNLLELPESNVVALDFDDLPAIPFMGNHGGGEMNYGPNILEQFRQFWQHPFDVKKQPKPECKPRKIPWGGDKIFTMFAMCCGPVPTNTGPGSRDRLRVPWRRKDCYLWEPTEKCTPGSIYCCFCKNERRVGFECVQYYTDEGIPASAPRKRDAVSMTRRQDDIAANEPFPAVDPNEPTSEIANLLPPPPATADTAMELGPTNDDKPGTGKGRSGPAAWTCTPEFERSQGGNPRNRDLNRIDDMSPPRYEPYRKSDETDGDLYDDLTVPDDWIDDDYYWSP
ncbi:hypothetical protein MMC07_000475 [Pseudocyphellaria aurata]|nr:hypothetical protein [Pseudocyphellaria aurata]